MSKSTLFEINITFDSGVPVTADQVQRAILRALATKAFGINGSAQVLARPLNSIADENVDIARPGVCPCRGCEERLVRRSFVCSRHFKRLPEKLQNLLKRAKSLGTAGFPGEAVDALTMVVLASVGVIARLDGKGNTRDEHAAMRAFGLVSEGLEETTGT